MVALQEEEKRKGMIRSCSLDFQPFPPSNSYGSRDFQIQSVSCSAARDEVKIFHNMRSIGVSDATELQAISILWLARRDMEEKFNFSRSNLPVPFMQIQLHGPSSLSLKKSLCGFLEKRRDRMRSASPYKHTLF